MTETEEEADKTRYANAISELIMFVRLMAKRHRLKPLEVIGVWKLCEDTLLSAGSNIEVALMLKDLKEKSILPKRAGKTDQKEVKNEGYA
jgi:hypothetical protein